MLRQFFEVSGDSQLYGGIAKALLLHGRYAFADGSGVLHSTLIRLPGYPLFLAGCFRLFGLENYYPACCVQILLDLVACILVALFAARISPSRIRRRAGLAALWLGMLCPFTAIYAAEPLTESLSLLCVAAALYCLACFQDQPGWGAALGFTGAVTYAALLRPDGALVGLALAPPLLLALFRGPQLAEREGEGRRRIHGQVPNALAVPGVAYPARMAIVCVLLALAPFIAWTWRNGRTFHVFQPLAPRYATDPGEETWPGWQRWMKTWCIDFVSTYDVYWNVPGAPVDLHDLPARAFDSPAQEANTTALFRAYHANGDELSPTIDDGFANLARQRIADHPFRYYLELPLARVVDMWVRPRVENLPIDLDWWDYSQHHQETRFSWAYAALNAVYLLLAVCGLCMRPRLWTWMLLYMLLRSMLLATIEAPEARYTLECFPMLFALGGISLASWLPIRRYSPSDLESV